MNQVKQPSPPRFFKAIGWSYALLGGLTVPATIFHFAVFSQIKESEMESLLQVTKSLPDIIQWFILIVEYYPIILSIELITGLLTLVSGVAFLKRKKWGGEIIRGFNLFLMLYGIAFTIFAIAILIQIYSTLAAQEPSAEPFIWITMAGIIIHLVVWIWILKWVNRTIQTQKIQQFLQ
ncbi:MAG: hypothetical protein Q8P27_02760 [Candidatus Peregrinibacteria bacterium]|nr:hypothetical protein [Candidatus Peregrinibacteria bacterium]